MAPSLAEARLLRSHGTIVYQASMTRIPSVYDIVNTIVYDGGGVA